MVEILSRHLNGHYGMCSTYHLVSNASRDFLKKVFFIAGEASGDIYGGLIANEMSRLSNIGPIDMRGWGGDKMTEAGVEVSKHYRELAYMGVWEVATHLGTILGNLKKCWNEIEAFKPDAIVLVDFPGFNNFIDLKNKNRDLASYLARQNGLDNFNKQIHTSNWKADTDCIKFLAKVGIVNPYSFHPTQRGHQQLADYFIEKIKD
jgi:hypothetical protein